MRNIKCLEELICIDDSIYIFDSLVNYLKSGNRRIDFDNFLLKLLNTRKEFRKIKNSKSCSGEIIYNLKSDDIVSLHIEDNSTSYDIKSNIKDIIDGISQDIKYSIIEYNKQDEQNVIISICETENEYSLKFNDNGNIDSKIFPKEEIYAKNLNKKLW